MVLNAHTDAVQDAQLTAAQSQNLRRGLAAKAGWGLDMSYYEKEAGGGHHPGRAASGQPCLPLTLPQRGLPLRAGKQLLPCRNPHSTVPSCKSDFPWRGGCMGPAAEWAVNSCSQAETPIHTRGRASGGERGAVLGLGVCWLLQSRGRISTVGQDALVPM